MKEINMSLDAKYCDTLKTLGVDLPSLNFQVEADTIFGNYRCTRIFSKDTERFLLRFPNKPANFLDDFSRCIVDYLVFSTDTTEKEIFIIMYLSEALLPAIQTKFNMLQKRYKFRYKERVLSSIDDLKKYQLTLNSFAKKNPAVKDSIDNIILEKLKFCLGLEEPPSLCGELIALQEIVESLFWYEDSEQGLEAFIKYIDPMMYPVMEDKFVGSNRGVKKIFSKEIASLITINLFNRWNENDSRLKSFLEVLLDFFSECSEIPLEQENRISVARMLNKYYPGSSVEESEAQSSQDKSLKSQDRRKLINIISELELFRNLKQRTEFLKLVGINTAQFVIYDSNILKVSITHLVDELQKHKKLGSFLRTLIEIHSYPSDSDKYKFILNLVESVEPGSNGSSSAKYAKLVAFLDSRMKETELKQLVYDLGIQYKRIEESIQLWTIINLVNLMKEEKLFQTLIKGDKKLKIRDDLINDYDWDELLK